MNETQKNHLQDDIWSNNYKHVTNQYNGNNNGLNDIDRNDLHENLDEQICNS